MRHAPDLRHPLTRDGCGRPGQATSAGGRGTSGPRQSAGMSDSRTCDAEEWQDGVVALRGGKAWRARRTRRPTAGSSAPQWPARRVPAERSGPSMADNNHSGVPVLLEATHRPQPRLQPAMVGLNPVAGVPRGAMPGGWQQVLEHCRIRRRSVGDHLNGSHLRRADGLLEEPTGRRSVPPRGHKYVDDLPELVDRSVYVAPLPSDLHIGVVHQTAIPSPVAAWPGGVGQQRREPLHPAVDGDVVDLDAALGQQLLDVAVGQAEPQVPAHRDDDDVVWEPEAGEGGPWEGNGA